MPWCLAAVVWSVRTADNEFRDRFCEGDPKGPRTSAFYNGYPNLCDNGVSQTGAFVVLANDLGGSVIVFSICAVVCLLCLVKRNASGACLGGTESGKKNTAFFFVFLWFVYVMYSSLSAYKLI